MPPPLLPKSLLLKGAIRKGEGQEAFWKSAAVAPRGPSLLKGSVHTCVGKWGYQLLNWSHLIGKHWGVS